MSENTEKLDSPQGRRWPSLSTSILIGLALGVAAGLFFGEGCRHLKWIGNVFIGLLQMAVLPYITLSLITHVGRLSATQGKRLALVGLAILCLLWVVGIALLLALSFSFPASQKGSFFSIHQVQSSPEPDWMALFVPSNPFNSLATNMVPAVVVFAIGMGIAFMGIINKTTVLDHLEICVDALSRLNRMMIRLSPIGIFAIAANAAGTMTVEQFGLIQGYILTYVASALLLVGVILPLFISSVTPFSYWQVLRASRESVIAAVVIGNTFVVLPLIIEGTKNLLAQISTDEENDTYSPEFLIPMVYAFPDIGRIVGLIFIPFAAWFYGTTIEPATIPALLGTGFLGSFGKPIVTIPLLLDIAHIPMDIFDLYLSVGVVTARFGDMIKTMHLFTFAIVSCCYLYGNFDTSWPKRLRGGLLALGMTIVVVMGINWYLHQFQEEGDQSHLITGRTLIEMQVEAVVEAEPGPNPVDLEQGESHLDRILRRNVVRIGYDPNKLPFSFTDDDGDLVGLDIELAHLFAGDLGVTIEFVPYDRSRLVEAFADDHFDVAISAIEGTVKEYARLKHSQPYMDLTFAIVTKDHRKKEFSSRDSIAETENLRFAVLRNSLIAERAPRALPNVKLIEITDESEYYDRSDEFDGLLTSAETGAAWSLIRPEFSVVNPLERPVRFPLYCLVADDPDLEQIVNRFLQIRTEDGTKERVYEYWILGKDPNPAKPRWCIARDVLGWME